MRSEYSELEAILAKEENEHTWEQIDKGLKKFHTAVRTNLTQDDEFINTLKKEWCRIGLIRSLATERTRLSATTLELLSSITRLQSSFAPLLPVYLPAILKLLCRTNKLYISRATTTITAIVKNTKLPEILKYILLEWKGEGGKSTSFRIAVVEIVTVMVANLDLERHLLELEFIIKVGATDKEPKVRQAIKGIYDTYQSSYPDRVDQFTGPLSPTAKKYLHIGTIVAATNTSSIPARTTTKRPKVTPIELQRKSALAQSTSTSTSSAASIRKQLSTNSLSKSTSALPKSNPLSKSTSSTTSSNGTTTHTASTHTLSRSATSSRADLKSSLTSSTTREIPPLPTPTSFPPPSRTNSTHSLSSSLSLAPPSNTSTPAGFRPHSSTTGFPSTSASSSRTLPPPMAPRFVATSLAVGGGKPVLLRKASRGVNLQSNNSAGGTAGLGVGSSSSGHGGVGERVGMSASRVLTASSSSTSSSAAIVGAASTNAGVSGFRPQRTGASRVISTAPLPPSTSSSTSVVGGSIGGVRAQRALDSAKVIIANSRKPLENLESSKKEIVPIAPIVGGEVTKEEVLVEESWDGDEGKNGIFSTSPILPLQELETMNLVALGLAPILESSTPTNVKSGEGEDSFFRNVAAIAVETPLPPSLTASPTLFSTTTQPIKKSFEYDSLNDLFGLSFSPIKPMNLITAEKELELETAKMVALPDTPPSKTAGENDWLFSPIKSSSSPSRPSNSSTGAPTSLVQKVEEKKEESEWLLDLKSLLPESFTTVSPFGTPTGVTVGVVRLPSRVEVEEIEIEKVDLVQAVEIPSTTNFIEPTLVPLPSSPSSPPSSTSVTTTSPPQKPSLFLHDETDQPQLMDSSLIEESYYLPHQTSTTHEDSLLWNQQQDQLDDSFLERSFLPTSLPSSFFPPPVQIQGQGQGQGQGQSRSENIPFLPSRLRGEWRKEISETNSIGSNSEDKTIILSQEEREGGFHIGGYSIGGEGGEDVIFGGGKEREKRRDVLGDLSN